MDRPNDGDVPVTDNGSSFRTGRPRSIDDPKVASRQSTGSMHLSFIDSNGARVRPCQTVERFKALRLPDRHCLERKGTTTADA